MADINKATLPNQSSEKLLTLIEVLSQQDEPIRLQDLAKKLSMNASTVLRFLTSLQKKDYVAQDANTDRYYLTYKICGIANNITSRTSIRHICMPYLRSISQIFGESANLSIEQNMMVVYIEVVNGPNQLLTTTQRIGNIAPMHCTGVGKLFLTNYTQRQLEQFTALKGMQIFTENTLTTLDELAAEIETAKNRGYAFDNEECEVGVRCVAAPIRNYTKSVVAGLSVSGPTTRMTDDLIYSKLSFLLDAAKEISTRLGYQP